MLATTTPVLAAMNQTVERLTDLGVSDAKAFADIGIGLRTILQVAGYCENPRRREPLRRGNFKGGRA
jgi:hypothetical protein